MSERKAIQVSVAENGRLFMTRNVWSEGKRRYIVDQSYGRPATPESIGRVVDAIIEIRDGVINN